MTTPAGQQTLEELQDVNRESFLHRTIYVFRRWPLIPFIILGTLIICAILGILGVPNVVQIITIFKSHRLFRDEKLANFEKLKIFQMIGEQL